MRGEGSSNTADASLQLPEEVVAVVTAKATMFHLTSGLNPFTIISSDTPRFLA